MNFSLLQSAMIIIAMLLFLFPFALRALTGERTFLAPYIDTMSMCLLLFAGPILVFGLFGDYEKENVKNHWHTIFEEKQADDDEEETTDEEEMHDDDANETCDENCFCIFGCERHLRVRRPRPHSKKIRFESPGALIKAEMKQIQMAADLSRNTTGANAKFEDFDPFKLENMEEGEVPSMWDYNPSCLPREFRDVEADSYLENPNQPNFCHLPKNILVRIASMLTPKEFTDLSLTCRFLHWRICTFGTCYVPRTVRMEIIDEEFTRGVKNYQVAPKMLHYKDGKQRGIFILQPFCLKKPFFFDTLELSMEITTQLYPQALKYILPMRKLANRVKLIHYKDKTRSVDVDVMADTMQQINVNSFRFWTEQNAELIHNFFLGIDTKFISLCWNKLEYFRQMEEYYVSDVQTHMGHVLSLTNRFGIYVHPCMKNTVEAVEKFMNGNGGLEFHAYIYFDYQQPMVFAMATLIERDNSPEIYSDNYGHIWKTGRVDKRGNHLIIKLYKNNGEAVVMIGLKKTFYKNQRRYRRIRRTADRDPTEDDSDQDEQFSDSYDDDLHGDYWTMKTAVEEMGKKKSEKNKKTKRC